MVEQSKIEYWVYTAEDDLKTAEAMLETSRFLWVGFMCHLVIEKMLKAHFVKVFNKFPPYTHSLLYLAEKTGIATQMVDTEKDFLDYLQQYNIRARYPTDKDSLTICSISRRFRKLLLRQRK